MLDRYDRKLLNLLQRDATLTYDELGASVALSPSACRRRVAAMRNAGIISKQVAIVDAAAVGLPIQVVALIVLEPDSREQHESFRAAIAAHPEITNSLFVTGSVDYVLEITTASLSAYHSLADALFVENPAVKRFESLIVMETVRRETFLQL